MTSLIYYIGLATLSWSCLKVALAAHLYLRPSKTSLARYKHGDVPWALITGASDGIGYGFAQELARRGFNIILHGRHRDKLEPKQQNIERDYPAVNVQLLVIDAAADSQSLLEMAMSKVQHLDITILVNNVGGFPPRFTNLKAFTEYTLDDIDYMVYVNARFLPRITRLAVPVLARNCPGLILNISSGGQIGVPYMVMYSATKGAVTSFSKALAREMKAEGMPIDVLAVIPGDVQSKSQPIPTAWNVPSSRAFAQATLDRIGSAVDRGMLELIPYWPHAILLSIMGIMPERLRQLALVRAMKEKMEWFDKHQ